MKLIEFKGDLRIGVRNVQKQNKKVIFRGERSLNTPFQGYWIHIKFSGLLGSQST